jgi:hypothetical protein
VIDPSKECCECASKCLPSCKKFANGIAARWKGQNTGSELFLGSGDLGVGVNRVEKNYVFPVGDETYPISLAWDGTTTVSMSVDSTTGLATQVNNFVGGAPAKPYNGACVLGAWDVMQIIVRDSRTDSAVELTSVEINGVRLQDGTGNAKFGVFDKSGSPGSQNWYVTGVDFTQAFTVAAMMHTDGGLTGNEAARVEFQVGCLVDGLDPFAKPECDTGCPNCTHTECPATR